MGIDYGRSKGQKMTVISFCGLPWVRKCRKNGRCVVPDNLTGITTNLERNHLENARLHVCWSFMKRSVCFVANQRLQQEVNSKYSVILSITFEKQSIASTYSFSWHYRSPKLCSSPNIIRMIKSRRMRWVDHLAHMEEMRNLYRILVRTS
jgi:hypothetical protein